jgi:hypothetical protein
MCEGIIVAEPREQLWRMNLIDMAEVPEVTPRNLNSEVRPSSVSFRLSY